MSRPENWRELVVGEALSWVGTRYHHNAHVKGHGIDCGWLIIESFCAPGIVPPIDPGEYGPQWFLHQGDEKYLRWIEQFCHPIELKDAQPADLLLYRMGRCVAHGAIVLDSDRMIHARQDAGAVLIEERRCPVGRGKFDSCWSLT